MNYIRSPQRCVSRSESTAFRLPPGTSPPPSLPLPQSPPALSYPGFRLPHRYPYAPETSDWIQYWNASRLPPAYKQNSDIRRYLHSHQSTSLQRSDPSLHRNTDHIHPQDH